MAVNYNFIEIGTSDFDSLIETVDAIATGIVVEPVNFYLYKLPHKPRIHKLCAAIGEKNSHAFIHYLNPNIIEKYQLPAWSKGCNMIGKNHPTVIDLLLKMNISPEEYFLKESVATYTLNTVFDMFQVNSVEVVKIDAEGDDCMIMRQLHSIICQNRIYKPRKIYFETNELGIKKDIEDIRTMFMNIGYKVTVGSEDSYLFY
jgi:FkbM family methyltransferase